MARAPKKVRRWRVGVLIRRRLERLHTGRFLREPVRRQDIVADVSVLRPRLSRLVTQRLQNAGLFRTQDCVLRTRADQFRIEILIWFSERSQNAIKTQA